MSHKSTLTSQHSKTILLITASFPYSPGEEFVEAELPFLVAQFDRVVIVPLDRTGQERKVPSQVEVETGLADSEAVPFRRKVLRLARHPLLVASALFHGAGKGYTLRKGLRAVLRVASCEEWMSRYLASEASASGDVLIYSYWTSWPVFAARLASRLRPNVVGIVSRAHRYDLYVPEQGDPEWPFRSHALKALDRLFVVSEHGLRYILGRHRWLAATTEVSRLGVTDYGMNESARELGHFVVCSCAYLTATKRIDLLVGALIQVGVEIPFVRLDWHHFGDGPLHAELAKLVASSLPGNVTATFHGTVPNTLIRSFYRSNPVDAFVNTSSSEGVPVSIMEAQCAGIPVIATSVGGTPELVDASNGVLLTSNPSVAEIAEAIALAIHDPSHWSAKRVAARKKWETAASAAVNYPAFARRLDSMFERHRHA